MYKYYYDCENRLTEVNDINDAPVASYKFDFAGRRVKKIVYGSPDVVRSYIYDGGQVVAEYDVNGTTFTLLRRFRYGPGIDEPICMWRTAAGGGAGWFYYHYDGLGSVVALSDVNGTIVESYEYDVFGEPTIYDYAAHQEVEESSVGNPYMFTGRRFDSETGLYYYRARYYEPYIGRFMSADPLGTVPDDKNIGFEPTMQYEDGMNLYAYCRNNPVNYIDPEGKIFVWAYHCVRCFYSHRTSWNNVRKCRERYPCDAQARWRCVVNNRNFNRLLHHCTKCAVGSWFI